MAARRGRGPLTALLGRLRQGLSGPATPPEPSAPGPWPPERPPATGEEWRACVRSAPEGDAKAVELLKEMAEDLASPDDASAELLLALAEFWQADSSWGTVSELSQRALELAPESLDAHLLLAEAQLRRSRPAAAIDTLRAALAVSDDDSQRSRVRLKLAEALLSLDRFEEAWELYAELGDGELGLSELLHLAYCAVRVGKPDAAERAYARAYPADSERDALGFDRLKAAGSQLRRFQRTDEALRLLAPLGPESSEEELWLAHRAAILEEDFPRAIELLELSAARNPGSERVALARAQLLELCGQVDAAVEVYRSTTHEFARYRAGSLLLERGGDARESVELYLAVAAPAPGLGGEDLATALSAEVDPALETDVAALAQLTSPDTATGRDAQQTAEILARIFPRLSHESTVVPVGLALARAYAALGEWSGAWRTITLLRSRHLPAVSLRKSGRIPAASIETVYAEMREALPLDEHLVMWESNLAESTSCNPLALCLAVLEHPDYAELQHVWIVEPGATIHPRLLGRDNVRFIAPGSFAHLRTLATAKHLINNSTYEAFFSKREGQRCLSTWHGIPWKTLGLDKSDETFAISGMQRSSLHADVILAPDEHTVRVLTRSVNTELLTTATLMRTDYPRNDLAKQLSAGARAEIRAQLGLSAGEKLVLFMPTWRGQFRQRKAEVERTLRLTRELAAHDEVGPGYRVVLRAHHYVRQSFASGATPADVLLAPERIDTYELLGAADALVTDYSSVLFDAASLGVPVVKLVGDIDDYRAERGLYFGPEEVPGANAIDAAEARTALAEALRDPRGFAEAYRAATERFGGAAGGTASRDVVDVFFGGAAPARVFPPPSDHDARRLLIYGGDLADGPVTTALERLLADLDGSAAEAVPGTTHGSTTHGSQAFAAHVFVQKKALEQADPARSVELTSRSRVIPFTASPACTVMEGEALAAFSRPQFRRSAIVEQQLVRLYLRDAARQFGATQFDTVLDFSGRDPRQTAFFALGLTPRSDFSGIVLHDDRRQQTETEMPGLAAGTRLFDHFDFTASDTTELTQRNRDYLERFGFAPITHRTLAGTEALLEALGEC